MSQRAVLLHLPKNKPIDIEFKDVNYFVPTLLKKDKQILHGVSGRFHSGELSVIMGPSGAGKSSLLNILTGFESTGMKGTVLSNGVERKPRGDTAFRKEACYIMQDDQLWPLFTVAEAMTMAADLKLGSSVSTKAKQMLIDDLLDSLTLGSTRHTACGRLSGGQKKRLSIALELIDNPPVMFLDEPTTGLDSSASLQVVSVLKALAMGGRTIVCTIHQPGGKLLELFDQVYILAEGRCVYQGATDNMVRFLSSVGLQCPMFHSPADYMLEVASGEYGNFTDQLAEAAMERSWRVSTEPAKPLVLNLNIPKPPPDTNKTLVLINTPTEMSRFWILLNRCFIQLFRDWTVTHLKCVLHILVGILLGLNFRNMGQDGSRTISNISYFFCTIVYLSYTSMMPGVLRFPSEMPVLKKERFNNWYCLKTYYMAFLAANLPVQMLYCLLNVSFSYFLSGQPAEWQRFAMFLVICLLTTVVAESSGLLLGVIMKPVNGTFAGAVFTAYMMLFGGFLVIFDHVPKSLYWLTYFSYIRYATEGLVVAMYGYGRTKLPCPEEVIYCHLRNPEVALKEVGMQGDLYWVDVLAMLGIFVGMRTFVFFMLKRVVKAK